MRVPTEIKDPVSIHSVKEVGVDWITVTCSDRRQVHLLENLAFVWLNSEEARGNKIRPWSMSGFTGFHCGEVSFGELNGTLLLRMSGGLAHRRWKTAYRHSTNCSRIDLEVTIEQVEQPSEIIKHHYKQAQAHFAGWRKPPAVHLWTCNTTSSTLYVNKRVSESFGRIYDKSVESKRPEYEGCLRYEVEFKGDMAHLVSTWLAEQEDERMAVLSRVSRFFRERGCAPGFLADPITPISVCSSRSDHERALRWLTASVRSSVQDLVVAGRLQEVLVSLGLHERVVVVSAKVG